jgi:hypothetical protein
VASDNSLVNGTGKGMETGNIKWTVCFFETPLDVLTLWSVHETNGSSQER